ncbi:hypothetical protein HQO24_10410 [Rhodococcus fascians]|nr:hypothetical protein [Rhodococcus fascians]MBY4396907.1 hypothetical protein [Rhodococcus fascians]MBY4407386.1 hypothetical protein [Rhodococcus fascians]MBY4421485.1 hypothetical protein [Rhodococcus fascians]MBY4460762.1 hypothetical protein [Rhodococcus fascians]
MSVKQFTTIQEIWTTVTDDHQTYSSGSTREDAIANHLQSNRDLKLAIADLAASGPLASKWEDYQFQKIRAIRRTITVTCTELTETVDSDDLPDDPFGWDRDGECSGADSEGGRP